MSLLDYLNFSLISRLTSSTRHGVISQSVGSFAPNLYSQCKSLSAWLPRRRSHVCLDWWDQGIKWCKWYGLIFFFVSEVYSYILRSFCLGTAEAQRLCDVGTDHYCSESCNRCSESQNVVMFVGGRSTQSGSGTNWNLNPSFMALNGSLPACLSSTKNDIHSSLTKIRTPAFFMNQGLDLETYVYWLSEKKINIVPLLQMVCLWCV